MSYGPNERFSWVTPYLMLGAQPAANDLAALRRAGITAILCVLDGNSMQASAQARHFAYLQVPVSEQGVPSDEDLRACCTFIDQHRARGEAVLVHCALGVGRSAAVSLAYLMRSGIMAGAALALLREKRTRVAPTATQIQAAIRFAETIAAPVDDAEFSARG